MQQPACLQIASTAAYSVKTTCVREASLEKEKKEEEEKVFSVSMFPQNKLSLAWQHYTITLLFVNDTSKFIDFFFLGQQHLPFESKYCNEGLMRANIQIMGSEFL